MTNSVPESGSLATTPDDESHGQTRWRLVSGLVIMALAVLLTVNVFLMLRQLDSFTRNSREHAFWTLCHTGTTPVQRTELFLKLVIEGNTSWQSAMLDGLRLADVDLSGAQLKSALFTSCEMKNIRFADANLEGAALDMSDLSNANFANARLRNATLFKSTLTDADFRNADLLSTSLEQAKGHGAKFIAAKMGDAFLPMADFTDAEFTGADLSGANLEAAILRGADLALANLFGADLTDTDFTNTNWWRSRGLTTEQLDILAIAYPPDPDATDSRKRDFDIWLSRRAESDTKERPSQK
jgi:uncharacterized protein YjbI with pentapeptide repeats